MLPMLRYLISAIIDQPLVIDLPALLFIGVIASNIQQKDGSKKTGCKQLVQQRYSLYRKRLLCSIVPQQPGGGRP